jgi:hypothetical protein
VAPHNYDRALPTDDQESLSSQQPNYEVSQSVPPAKGVIHTVIFPWQSENTQIAPGRVVLPAEVWSDRNAPVFEVAGPINPVPLRSGSPI